MGSKSWNLTKGVFSSYAQYPSCFGKGVFYKSIPFHIDFLFCIFNFINIWIFKHPLYYFLYYKLQFQAFSFLYRFLKSKNFGINEIHSKSIGLILLRGQTKIKKGATSFGLVGICTQLVRIPEHNSNFFLLCAISPVVPRGANTLTEDIQISASA